MFPQYKFTVRSRGPDSACGPYAVIALDRQSVCTEGWGGGVSSGHLWELYRLPSKRFSQKTQNEHSERAQHGGDAKRPVLGQALD